MELTVIEARDLSEAWFQCVRRVLVDGHRYIIDKGSFEGQERVEFDMVAVHVRYPSSRPLVPTVPQGIPPPSTMDYVEQYLPYLMTSAKKPGEEYTYGTYLEPQIAEVIKRLKSTPNTNQSYMTVGDPSTIFMTDPPCLRGIDVRARYGKLHFAVYFRSWDLWAGFPSNLAAIQLLKEYMADEIGLEDGDIFAFSKGLHLYGYSLELAKSAVSSGKITINGKDAGTHRVAWELTKGKIPNGLQACHHCDNPACCRPDHLFLGTQSDNIKDSVNKKRQIGNTGNKSLTPEQVEECRNLIWKLNVSQKTLGIKYNVHQSTISRALSTKGGCNERST